MLNKAMSRGVERRFESRVMHFASALQSRKVRTWVVPIALVVFVILIAALFLRSRRPPQQFEMNDLYGLLD